MISAVDSSVILDVLADSRAFADASISALRLGAQEGKLIVCECVCAEIFPAIGDTDRFRELFSEWQLVFVPSTEESAARAGEMFAAFLASGREKTLALADFLIGAHALAHADRIIARDRGFFRDYFKDLPLLDPSSL